jgi:hypothetical protein
MAGYSQNDPQWKNDPLGTDGQWTVGQAGCLITSGADVLKAFGHDITPGDLNRLAQENGLITADGDINRWDWLHVLFPEVLTFVEHVEWGSAPAPLDYFDIRNDLDAEIILMIDDSPASGIQTHFMRTVGWNGAEDVIVDDVWDGIRKGVSAYGARWNPAVHAKSIIYNATKYTRYVPPAVPTPVEAPPATPEPTPTEPIPAAPATPPVATDPAPAPTETNTPKAPPISSPPVQETPSVIPAETLWERFIGWLVKILGIK